MPYSKVKNHPKCPASKPIGLVLSETGQLVGCHTSEESANKQIAKIEMEKEKDRLIEAINEAKNRQINDIRTSVMVAWYPPKNVAERLVNDGQEFPDGSTVLKQDDLHVTLAFLGHIDEEIDAEVIGKVDEILGRITESLAPFEVHITGNIKRFDQVEDGTVDAIWAEINSDGFHEINDLVMGQLGFENTHGAYKPHLTLAYVPTGESDDSSVPEIRTTATELIMKIGDIDRRTYQLVDSRPEENQEEHAMGEQIHYIRALPDTSQVRAEDLLKNTSLPVPFIASTEGIKSDGKDLRMSDWDLNRYQRYGPILWVHDYTHPPLGIGDATAEDKLRINVTFDEDDPFAMLIRNKAVKGMMGGSVGWRTRRDKKNELIEFSMVPVGVDPDALPDIQRMGLRAMQAEISEMLGEDSEESLQAYIEALRNDVLEQIKETLEEMTKADEAARGNEVEEEPEEEEDDGIASGRQEEEEEHRDTVPAPTGEEEEEDPLARAGAMLSKMNREDLAKALALIKGVLERATPEEDVPSFSAMRGEEEVDEVDIEPEEVEETVDQRGQDDPEVDLDPKVLDQILEVLNEGEVL